MSTALLPNIQEVFAFDSGESVEPQSIHSSPTSVFTVSLPPTPSSVGLSLSSLDPEARFEYKGPPLDFASPSVITSTPVNFPVHTITPEMSLPGNSNHIPAMMPSPHSKEAPSRFTGRYDEVRTFLERYNALCETYRVTDETQKCKRVRDYCSHKVILLIEGLQSYANKDWFQLEQDLLRYYDADLRETRYIIRDLALLTQKWKHRSIKSLTKWKRYERKFITIGGWLRTKGKISESEQAAYFWKGINRHLRERIENRLAAEPSPPSLTVAFPMKKVIEVVEKLSERDRFDYDFAESDSELPELIEDSDSSNESDNEESDDEETKKRVVKRKKTVKRTRQEDDESGDSDVGVRNRPLHKITQDYQQEDPTH